MIVDRKINIQPGEVRCPRCFGKDIVRSRPRGWRDAVMRIFGRVPRHCRFCERRFYIPMPIGAAGVVGSDPVDLGENR